MPLARLKGDEVARACWRVGMNPEDAALRLWGGFAMPGRTCVPVSEDDALGSKPPEALLFWLRSIRVAEEDRWCS
jgi:hypothetical protein